MQYQFLGYWGYGLPLELNSIIAKVTRDKNTKFLDFNQGKTFCGISYIGGENLPITRGDSLIASLSASGFSDSMDAWVKVKNNQLILGREPFGRVPLYWGRIEQIIWFASELKLLLCVIPKPSISVPGFYGYTCFSYVPTPLTPVENIFAIPPGVEQFFSHPKTYTQQRYEWRENLVQIKDKDEAITHLQTLLKNVISRQVSNLYNKPVIIGCNLAMAFVLYKNYPIFSALQQRTAVY